MLPVFVISIKGSERRSYITTLFAQYGIRFTFWDAVVGYDLSDAEKATVYDAVLTVNAQKQIWYRSSIDRLTNAEIGCALSHRQIYQHMVATGIKEALIFEDDVTIDQDVLAFIKIRRQLIPDDAELLLLGNSNDYGFFFHRSIWFLFARKTPFRRELKKFSKSNKISLIVSLLDKTLAFCFSSKSFYNNVRICKFYNVVYGAFAYYITHSGAQKLLDAQSPKIRYTSDVVTGDVIIGGHTLYILYPSLCLYNKTFASEIDRLDQLDGFCRQFSTGSTLDSMSSRMWFTLKVLLNSILRTLAVCFPKTRPMLYTLRNILRKALYKKSVRSTL